MRVKIAVRKKITNTIVAKNLSDLLFHAYRIYLDTKKIYGQTEQFLRDTKVFHNQQR